MAKFVTLDPGKLSALRQIDERLVSYNIEMTEVTGGTFWKAYTEAQVDGTEEFPIIQDWADMGKLQQWYDPIDSTNPRLIKLAKELGTAWVRVSGTWANKTYYDFDNKYGGQVPEGFQNVLSKQQWLNLLDFVKAVDGKLLVSIANCPGIHNADEPMPFEQAELLFRTSKEYGVPISAAEFTNEPNLIALSGLPKGYTAEDHARDHDLFGAWPQEATPLPTGTYNGTAIYTSGDFSMEWNFTIDFHQDGTFTLVNDAGEEKGAGTYTQDTLTYTDDRTCTFIQNNDGTLVLTSTLPYGTASIDPDKVGDVILYPAADAETSATGKK